MSHNKVLHRQAREFISSLTEYFEREKHNGGPLTPLSSVRERVAEALHISVRTVTRIKHEKATQPILESPGKKRRSRRKKTENLPETTKMEIRNSLYEMYSQRKHVTTASLNKEIKRKAIEISDSSLGRVLHSIGFKYQKDNPRRALMERNNIVCLRQQFLREYMKNLSSALRRDVIFLDETWIFSKGSTITSWQDSSIKSVRKTQFQGRRYIVLHAGGSNGFINDASLTFTTKSQSADYHGDMNGEIFIKWIREKLIPNLEEPSLIVMDNAPYHSMLVEKNPSSAWTKNKITEWLDAHNVHWETNMFKPELLLLSKQNVQEKKYIIDEILRSHGHEVLRLPPYHCEFNAIELIWAKTKAFYNIHINNSEGKSVEDVWYDALSSCTPNMWENCVRHTENLIKKWYEREVHIDDFPEIIINLEHDSSSSHESEE